MAKELHFWLSVTREQALRYYEGNARVVSVVAKNGQRIQFPAENIRPFINENGVEGHFSIQYDNNHKLIEIKQI